MPSLCFEEHQSLAARAGVSVLALGAGWGGGVSVLALGAGVGWGVSVLIPSYVLV